MTMEKLPPHSLEAEEAVLSAILLDAGSLYRVSDLLKPEDFYRLKHQLIYETMLFLDRKHREIDFVTIGDELECREKLDDVGGSYGIANLINAELNADHIEAYAQTIRQMRELRDVIALAHEMVANAFARDPQTVVKAEETLHRLARGNSVRREVALKDAVSDYMQKLSDLQERRNRGEVTGIPTGFSSIDQVLGGLQKSDLITLAARPARGKTSLALSIAQHVIQHVVHNSVQQQYNVLMFSLEMGKEQLTRRLISMESGVDQTRLRTGDWDDDEWEPLINAATRLSDGQMWIDDTPGLRTSEMRSRARRIQSEHNIDLIIVDYLQLMQGVSDDGKLLENRVQEVSKITRDLKELARELDVPVLALAQLSRAVEQRGDKVPQLSDLRESGSIEQDSDVVMFIHHDETAPSPFPDGELVNIIVAKHRNGPTGVAQLKFKPRLTLFENVGDDIYGQED